MGGGEHQATLAWSGIERLDGRQRRGNRGQRGAACLNDLGAGTQAPDLPGRNAGTGGERLGHPIGGIVEGHDGRVAGDHHGLEPCGGQGALIEHRNRGEVRLGTGGEQGQGDRQSQ